MYLSDVCTLPVNIAGIPGISIPAGFAKGLPIGMQIIGKSFAEETLFKISYAYQQVTDWHKQTAKV
jgi:aspartyl-tRNA(Asn)/glutamyl-tRNA(Gln) amidotransferase subunit A